MLGKHINRFKEVFMKTINDLGFVFCDFPKFSPITQIEKDRNIKRIFTGGVRINKGAYRTEQEDKNYRIQSLKRKLP